MSGGRRKNDAGGGYRAAAPDPNSPLTIIEKYKTFHTSPARQVPILNFLGARRSPGQSSAGGTTNLEPFAKVVRRLGHSRGGELELVKLRIADTKADWKTDEEEERMNCYRAAPAYQNLETGLRDMIRGGRIKESDIPDDWQWMTEALSKISAMGEGMGSGEEKAVEIARSKYLSLANEDIEIDDLPATSEADDGTWVNAWLWVYDEEVSERGEKNSL